MTQKAHEFLEALELCMWTGQWAITQIGRGHIQSTGNGQEQWDTDVSHIFFLLAIIICLELKSDIKFMRYFSSFFLT